MSRSLRTELALDALEQAFHFRPVFDGLFQQSNRSVQYMSIRYTDRLAEAGIELSFGSVGDSYSNSMAEKFIGLYKTEVINQKGPWRGMDHVDYETLVWVDLVNKKRLLGPSGDIPPVDYESYTTSSRRSRPWWSE